MGDTYRVVINGAREGLADDEVIERLAALFNMPAENLRPKFLSGPFAAKKAVDLATAQRYRAFLEQQGCLCAIEPEAAAPGPSAPLPALPATSPAPARAQAETPAQPGAARRSPALPRGFVGRFDVRKPLNKGAKRRHMLHGKGELVFTDAGLNIRGKRHRPFWFSAKEDFLVGYDGLLDAMADGKVVHFNVEGLARDVRTLSFVAASADEAREIVALLPERQSDVFRQHHQDTQDFKQSLDAVSTVPIVTYALVLANIAVFLLMAKSGAGLWLINGDAAIRWGSDYGPLTLRGEWWRMGTACFIHFGILHLAFNMLALFHVGRLVEKLYGTLHYLLLYAFAGLSGSVVSLLWHPTINSAGASGAIFGVFGAMLAYMLSEDNGVPKSIMATQRNSMLAFIGYNLVNGFTHTGIDNGAHIGGLIGGIVMGFLLMRPLGEGRNRPAALRLIVASAAGVVLLALASYPLHHPNEGRRQEMAFLATLRAFAPEETKVLADHKALAGKLAAGTMSPSEFAQQIEEKILPQWEVIRSQMAEVKLDESSRFHALDAALENYLSSRVHHLQLLAQAVRTNDPAIVGLANLRQKEIEEELQAIRKLSSI